MRNNIKVMGVTIGTTDGWDELDILAITFYQVKLNKDALKFWPNLPLELLSKELETVFLWLDRGEIKIVEGETVFFEGRARFFD